MMTPSRRPVVRTAVAGLGLALAVVAGASGVTTAPEATEPRAAPPAGLGLGDPMGARVGLLDAAAAWRDSLEAHRAPQVPLPGDQESLILVLSSPPLGALAPARRAAAAEAIAEEQEAVRTVMAELGATVGASTRVAANTLTIRIPTGRADAVAAVAQVRTVVPVRYLAPASASRAPGPAIGAPRVSATVGPGGGRAVRIALIDGGVDPTHPALGGGIGPSFPILGGLDLVDGDTDPRPSATALDGEAHGTQMAGLILGGAALEGLPPDRRPRMVVYRVVATEPVAGRERPVALSDRVLQAIERAVDPNGDGDPSDRAEVLVLGVSSAFSGGGVDPVADALEVADRLGSSVVLPAGNDGPTLSHPGSLGSLASVETAIVVGGLVEADPRRVAGLQAIIGPASARLDALPLLGPDPAVNAAMPVVVARNEAGPATGDQAHDYLSPEGANRVDGALVVVRRGGQLHDVARLASAFGARALAIWDDQGPATFPSTSDGMGLGLPTVGLGPDQGRALVDLAAGQPDLRVSIDIRRSDPAGSADVASFSSWGPTTDGRQKPDLMAPAVAIAAPLPGRGADGQPRDGSLTGTSAAAAEVAARVARLRADRPELAPDQVRSLLIQGAGPLRGLATERQGAGRAAAAAEAGVQFAPAIVAVDAEGAAQVELSDISDRGGVYRLVAIEVGGVRRGLGAPLRLDPGSRRVVGVTLPAGAATERVVALRADGTVAAVAPVVAARPAPAPVGALGRPEVTVRAGLAEARVRVGTLRRSEGRITGVVLHSLRLQLVPAAGGAPILLAGAKRDADLPAGTYRYLIARRDAHGAPIGPGVYRLRAIAAGPGGVVLRRESRGFSLR